MRDVLPVVVVVVLSLVFVGVFVEGGRSTTTAFKLSGVRKEAYLKIPLPLLCLGLSTKDILRMHLIRTPKENPLILHKQNY